MVDSMMEEATVDYAASPSPSPSAASAPATDTVSPSPASEPEIVIPLDWEQAADAIAAVSSPAPVVLVCGPKNTGKSTFSRYLLNTLLRRYKKVGYMDTDVGQPEFVPPGCLSLNIVDEIITDYRNPRLKSPERLIFFGDLSSKRDPEAFLDYSFHLYDYFVKHCQPSELGNRRHLSVPLIINTPGWVKGTGYDVLVEILRHTCPTKIVQICSPVGARNLPPGAFWLSGEEKKPSELISIFTPGLVSSSKSVLNKNAHNIRDHRLFDYFRQCFPEKLNITTNKELAYFLASLPPYEVQLSRIRVMHLHCQVPSSEIFHSLNATIVGLAASTDVNADSQSFTPWCLGLGIVRGIDVGKGVLYMITPVPLCRLQKVDLLLQGFVDIPTGLLQVRKCVSPYMSTNVLHKM